MHYTYIRTRLLTHAFPGSPNPSSSNMPPNAYSAPPERPPYEEQAAYTADLLRYGHAHGESSRKCVKLPMLAGY